MTSSSTVPRSKTVGAVPHGWWQVTDKACEYLLASAIAPVLMLLFQTHLVYVVEH